MAIQVGDKIPEVTLMTMGTHGPTPVSTGDLFKGKKAVLFGVPGAFTPTCSDGHLPGFVKRGDDLRAKGVDLVACVAVNDVFVVHAWGNARGVGDQVMMLADGNGDFAKAMGQELDARAFLMGIRSQRYAAIVEDGVLKALFQDPPPEVRNSSVESVLQAL
ncbi:MAG TPA: peroxiredoxin [Thermoanaerobaculia bacterium]|jgi:peroxiredoxin|nr:peroxiredoxin [Thermoanaerobaculia bacterium]